jgi:hypothetical protein
MARVEWTKAVTRTNKRKHKQNKKFLSLHGTKRMSKTPPVPRTNFRAQEPVLVKSFAEPLAVMVEFNLHSLVAFLGLQFLLSLLCGAMNNCSSSDVNALARSFA